MIIGNGTIWTNYRYGWILVLSTEPFFDEVKKRFSNLDFSNLEKPIAYLPEQRLIIVTPSEENERHWLRMTVKIDRDWVNMIFYSIKKYWNENNIQGKLFLARTRKMDRLRSQLKSIFDDDRFILIGDGRFKLPPKQLTFNGKTMTVRDWAKEFDLKPLDIYNRLKLGWPIEDIFTRRINGKKTSKTKKEKRKED